MANVLFKQGLQASLDTIRTNLTAIEGTFYLTTDTHRLYVGRVTSVPRSSAAQSATGLGATQSATACDAVPVNEGITFVNSIGELPTITTSNYTQYIGQFYYIGGTGDPKNILCVYNGNGAQGGWVQINPNTDTKITGIEYNISADSTNNTASVEIEVQVTTPDGKSQDTSIKKTFKLAGERGITIEGNNTTDTVTIKGEQYDLSANVDTSVTGGKATLNLTSASGTDNSSVNIVGSGNVHIKSKDGAVQLESDTYQLHSVTGGAGDGNNGTEGFHVTVKDSLNGLEAADKVNSVKTGTINPEIAVGADTSKVGNKVKFINGVATLPVYSKADIDTMIHGLNAMTFKGLVNNSKLPPTVQDHVSLGDTYKASSDFQFNNNGTVVNIKVGDLLIANSAAGEDANGYITTGLYYEVITSGDDDDAIYTYKGIAIDNGIQIGEQHGNDKNNYDVVGQFVVAGSKDSQGNALILVEDSPSTTSSANDSNTVTIKHAAVTKLADASQGEVTQSLSSGPSDVMTVTAVVGVETTAEGHVKQLKTKTWKLRDTNGQIHSDAMNVSTSSATKDGIVTYTSVLSNTVKSMNSEGTVSGTKAGQVEFKSSSLTISSTAATIDANSGQATKNASMTIEMTWGTF